MIRPGAEDMVAYLNDLLERDREWFLAVYEHRPACNEKIVTHPTLQARRDPNCAGFLGVINGFFGVHDDGPLKGKGPIVAMVLEHANFLGGFKILEESDLLPPEKP